jgi:hypothetical protein
VQVQLFLIHESRLNQTEARDLGNGELRAIGTLISNSKGKGIRK